MSNGIIIMICVLLSLICFILGLFISWIYFFKLSKVHKDKITKIKLESEKIANSIKTEAEAESIKIIQNATQYAWNKKHEHIKNEKILNLRTKNLLERKKILNNLEQNILINEKKIKEKLNLVTSEFYKIADTTPQEAKEKIFKDLRFSLRKEMNEEVKKNNIKIQSSYRKRALDIISNAIEKYSPIIVADKTISIIKLENNDIKGKIIGKDGRNIRVFEKCSGVDLVINDTPGIIRLSSFNSYRREIAKTALLKLIDDGRIQPNRIEEYLAIAKEEHETKIAEAGHDIMDLLNFDNMNPQFAKYFGLLKFRTSYGQNALEHCIEVGKLAASMASELNLNPNIALRAGFLHDIGKSVDEENEGSHVLLGAKLARKFNESEIVINAIESHHGDVPVNNIYSVLVSAADTLSAARPGARNNNLEFFIQRMTKIEGICKSIPGIKQCYALQSGRQIRIVVNSNKIKDIDMHTISLKIKTAIKNSDIIIPGDINIDIIREVRISDKIKK